MFIFCITLVSLAWEAFERLPENFRNERGRDSILYRSDGSSKMPPRQKRRRERRSGVRRGVKRNGERNPPEEGNSSFWCWASLKIRNLAALSGWRIEIHVSPAPLISFTHIHLIFPRRRPQNLSRLFLWQGFPRRKSFRRHPLPTVDYDFPRRFAF